MAIIIPNYNTNIKPKQEIIYATNTYRLDIDQKRIQGMVDGRDAVIQAANKILFTERFAYVIYSQYYGAELQGLIGKNEDYIKTVLKTRIADALREDSRIQGISDFNIEKIDSESVHVTFSMESNNTKIPMALEVTA